jgi:glycerophosphoryl diester phosphodiesterase
LIAHRGASREAPENTLASFCRAFAQGADGIEGDFRLAADGEIVCIHDATTGRTAGVDFAVAGATLAELRSLDVGAWKGSQWTGERIPTLAEVLAVVPPGKTFYIEVKCGPEIVRPLQRALFAADFDPARTIILAFDAGIVAAVRTGLPRVKALWLTGYRRRWRCGWTPDVATILRTLAESGATGLGSQASRAVDADLVRALREAGQELHVWTVDTLPLARRFVALGVDAIITNRPGRLRERLESPGPQG